MQNIRCVTAVARVCCALFLMASCSANKDIPQGKRVSVLEQGSVIKPDVADATSRISVPAAVESSNWLQKSNNAQHLSDNYRVSEQFKRQWKADFGKGGSKREFLISRPVAEGDKIYTLDANGLLRAFNLQDGEVAWATDLVSANKYEDATALKGVGLAKKGGVIYAVTGYGTVFAVNAKNGAIIWQKDMDTPLRIAPTLADGKIFIQSTDNKIFALSTANGDVMWDYDIALENTTSVGGASPAYSAADDVVIIGFSNGELQSFNASFGTALWADMLISNRQAYSSTYLHAIKAEPIIDKNVVYALGVSDVMAAINLRNGERIWEKNIGGEQTPLLVENVLYVVTNQKELVALEKTTGKVLWASALDLGKNADKVRVFAPLMINGNVFLTFSDGRIATYAPKTGQLVKTIDLNENFNSSPIVMNGYLIFTTENAKLIVFK